MLLRLSLRSRCHAQQAKAKGFPAADAGLDGGQQSFRVGDLQNAIELDAKKFEILAMVINQLLLGGHGVINLKPMIRRLALQPVDLLLHFVETDPFTLVACARAQSLGGVGA